MSSRSPSASRYRLRAQKELVHACSTCDRQSPRLARSPARHCKLQCQRADIDPVRLALPGFSFWPVQPPNQAGLTSPAASDGRRSASIPQPPALARPRGEVVLENLLRAAGPFPDISSGMPRVGLPNSASVLSCVSWSRDSGSAVSWFRSSCKSLSCVSWPSDSGQSTVSLLPPTYRFFNVESLPQPLLQVRQLVAGEVQSSATA